MSLNGIVRMVVEVSNKITWISSAGGVSRMVTPAVRLNKIYLWFNKAGAHLIKGWHNALLGFNEMHIFIKRPESSEFGFRIHRVKRKYKTKRKSKSAPIVYIMAGRFIKEAKIKAPISIKLKHVGELIIGEIPVGGRNGSKEK